MPWIDRSADVILWTSFKVPAIGAAEHPLAAAQGDRDHALPRKPYAAIWNFQPLATGTAILLSSLITAVPAILAGLSFFRCIGQDPAAVWLAVITVMLILSWPT